MFVCLMLCTVGTGSTNRSRLVVLFTSDLHSALLPGNGDSLGGYAMIATILQQEKEAAERAGAAVLVVDGGDIAMGSIFHTIYREEAVEYRAMARMGYDAVAFGNHDFDFGTDALVAMYRAAHKKDSCMEWPLLLSANLQVSGVASEKYRVFERNGLKVGLFGIMGKNSFNVIATDTGKFNCRDAVTAAREAVEALQLQGADYIIALSHGGTLNGDDIELAKKVGGIDFIVSGHDHCLLVEPLKVNGTFIGAAGCEGSHVGRAVFKDGVLEEYSLIGVNADVPQERVLAGWIDSMYNVVGERFFKLCGGGLDDTLAYAEKPFYKRVDENGRMPLGSNVAESYRQSAIAALPQVPEDDIVGFVPYGVVRGGLAAGAVTVRDAFQVLSLGENESGYLGYPLVYAWLQGKELEDLCEMSVSVSPMLEDTRMFFSGLQYRYNGARPPFMKVDRVLVGGRRVVPEKLYLVVTGQYTAGLTSLLEKESFGLLSAQAKDAAGNPLPGGKFYSLRGPDGKQIPEWEAFARYLQQGKLSPAVGEDSVENDDFVPLGYTLAAALLCAIILYCLGKRETGAQIS